MYKTISTSLALRISQKRNNLKRHDNKNIGEFIYMYRSDDVIHQRSSYLIKVHGCHGGSN